MPASGIAPKTESFTSTGGVSGAATGAASVPRAGAWAAGPVGGMVAAEESWPLGNRGRGRAPAGRAARRSGGERRWPGGGAPTLAASRELSPASFGDRLLLPALVRGERRRPAAP